MKEGYIITTRGLSNGVTVIYTYNFSNINEVHNVLWDDSYHPLTSCLVAIFKIKWK